MIELLNTYNPGQIFLYAVIILFIIKEGWEVIDYFKGKSDKNKENIIQQNNDKKNLADTLTSLEQISLNQSRQWEEFLDSYSQYNLDMEDRLNSYDNKLQMLIESDKDDIKSFIVSQHHFFIRQGWIDDYSLDVIEKRYSHYVDEGGNSYIKKLMGEIRKLSNLPPEEK